MALRRPMPPLAKRMGLTGMTVGKWRKRYREPSHV